MYFFSMLNQAFAKNDPSLFNNLVTANCKSCSTFAQVVADQKATGKKYIGNYVGVDTVSNSTFSTTEAKMYVTDTEGTRIVQDSTGKTIDVIKPSSGALSVSLIWSDGWLVDKVQVAAA